MLSVRLPENLEEQLSAHCKALHLTKSAVVQTALEHHLRQAANKAHAVPTDPFLAMIGSGNRKYSTEQIMRMTRGDDWNQP